MGREYILPWRKDRLNNGNCSCPACRRRYKFDKKPKVVKDDLCDVPLFCCVFPEGFVGSCGFRVDGWCMVFENGCVRWNEFGDSMDYSVGRESPFR